MLERKGKGKKTDLKLRSNPFKQTQNEFKGVKPLKRTFKKNFPLESVERWIYERQIVNQSILTEIKGSIHRSGVVTPLIMRKMSDGSFMGLGGYLRSVACASLGITEVPAVIYSGIDDLTALDIAIVDNVQHHELTDWDCANMLNMYLEVDPPLKIEEICTRVQKSPSWVSQKLQVLKDSLAIQSAVENGILTEAQARSVRRLPESLHDKAVESVTGKTVRETAQAVKELEETEKEAVIQAEIETLKGRLTEIDQAETTKVNLVSECSKLEGKLKATTIENKDVNKIMRTVETIEKDYLPTVQELAGYKADLKETKKMLPDYPVEDLNKDLKSLDTEIGKHEAKIQKLNTQLKKMKAERDKVKKERQTVMSKISEYNERKRKVRNLTELVTKVTKEVQKYKENLGDSIKDFDSLKAKLSEHETDMLNKRMELSSQIANLKSSIASLTGKINNRSTVEKKIRALNTELDAIQGEETVEAPKIEA